MLLISRSCQGYTPGVQVYEKILEIASFNLFFLSSKALQLVSNMDQSLESMVITRTTSPKKLGLKNLSEV